MKVVILAAGKGNRLKPLTEITPKPLLLVHGKPILEHIFNSLPDGVSEILIITKHLEDQIEKFAKKHGAKTLTQIDMTGTYGALFTAKDHLPGDFLVINGDDIHTKEDLENLVKTVGSFGIQEKIMPNYHSIKVSDGMLDGIVHTDDVTTPERNVATGAYFLNKSFFDLKPHLLSKESEYSIPHTLVDAAKTYPIKIVDFTGWKTINTIEDLENINKSESF